MVFLSGQSFQSYFTCSGCTSFTSPSYVIAILLWSQKPVWFPVKLVRYVFPSVFSSLLGVLDLGTLSSKPPKKDCSLIVLQKVFRGLFQLSVLPFSHPDFISLSSRSLTTLENRIQDMWLAFSLVIPFSEVPSGELCLWLRHGC